MAGKKGRSGRKSKYKEIADAMDAHRIFFSEHDKAALEAKIESGTFSLRDRLVLTGMAGDTSILAKTLHKAVPDTVEHSGANGGAIEVTVIKYAKDEN